MSFLNPDEALNLYDLSPNRTLKFGISDAQTYHWLHTMKALGRIDATVTADYPIAAVFSDNGTKTYVAHNYSDNQITVTYSDGFQLTVPANQMATNRGNAISGIIEADKTQTSIGGTINLTLNTSTNGITKVEFYNNDVLFSMQRVKIFQLTSINHFPTKKEGRGENMVKLYFERPH